jgi:hypothetical protein
MSAGIAFLQGMSTTICFAHDGRHGVALLDGDALQLWV